MGPKNQPKLIIFDIDGDLIDVTQSYRLAIKKTAEFFLGRILDMGEVTEIKDRGINDDCDASELLIQKNGGDFRKKVIIKKFQEYYLGREFDGLVKNEKCIIKEKTLKQLKGYKLAIFTGRPKEEAEYGLKRFKIQKYFDIIITQEDVKELKPAPDGLIKILSKANIKNDQAIYVGDNLSDLKAAKSANINFIGVVDKNSENSKAFLESEGADIVLNNVNDITKVIK